jgi:hypothetical membrane protein
MKHLTRFAGLIAILFGLIGVGISMYQQRLNIISYKPLSYLGTTSSAPIFGAGLVLAATFMLVFYIYLRSYYKVSRVFSLGLILSLLSLVVIALVKDKVNNHASRVHWTAAYTFYTSCIFLLYKFSKDNPLSKAGKISLRAAEILFLAFIPELYLSIHGLGTDSCQIFSVLVFSSWVIAATIESGTDSLRQSLE